MSGSKSQQFTILNIDKIFNFCQPKPPLSKFVDSLWLYEGNIAGHQTQRILPTGTLELVINLRQNELLFYDAEHRGNCSRFSGAVVSGAYGHRFAPHTTEEITIIGVHFKPGGAFPFLGLPATISPTLTLIWKHFGDRRPVGCGSAFLRQELLPSGFSCSRRLC